MECNALNKGETRPPKPRRRLRVEVTGGESSSCQSSEDRSEDASTELPSSESSEDNSEDS